MADTLCERVTLRLRLAARDWRRVNEGLVRRGTFNVACHVRDGRHAGVNKWDDHKEFFGYSLLSALPNSPPTISSLSPDKASGSQLPGSTITWTCSASDPEGDVLVFRFFVRSSGGSWSIVQDWSGSNAWSWTPSTAGSYDVACHVRDGKHQGPSGWDDHKEAYGYVIASGMPAASLVLDPGALLGKQTVKPNLRQPTHLMPLLALRG
jgi:hypothetical protein